MVDILILNWNHADDTLALLASCVGVQTAVRQVVVIDNGSTDDSVQRIAESYPSVLLLETGENLGFAKGMNVGLRQVLVAGAEWVLMLNNDTRLAPDMVETLLRATQTAEACASAPIICYASDPEIIWSAGAFRQTATNDIQGHQIGQRYQNLPPYEVDYATACALLLHRDCLQDVGLFDEQFFMYYEDLDYCWRLQNQGIPILVVPQARLWHEVAQTIGGTDSPSERYWMARSSVLFFRKWTAGWGWLVVIPFRLVSALRTTWRLVINGRWTAVRAHWRGLWHGLTKQGGNND